jgi:hypothetical protein
VFRKQLSVVTSERLLGETILGRIMNVMWLMGKVPTSVSSIRRNVFQELKSRDA